jgi:antitoxin component YwqK of YwqJK toxin-antitoxin module
MKTNFKNILFYFLIVINISNCIYAQQSKNKTKINDGKRTTYSNVPGLKTITNYKNGKPNGECVTYLNNGSIYEKGNYVDGKKMGEWVRNDEGKVYKNTHKEGEGNYDEIVYDSHGKIFSKGSYFNHKPDGEFIEADKRESGCVIYNSENRIISAQNGKEYVSKGVYIEGQKQGIWIDYYENGTVRKKISFMDGFRDGKANDINFDIAYSFSWDCNTYRNRMIANNILKDTLPANRKENNNLSEIYKKKEGKWQYNYDDGIKLIVNYVEGIKSGDWIGYNENDSIIEKGNYTNGKMNGDWIYYDDSGTIMLEKGHYSNGIPDGEWIEIDDNQKNIFTKDDAELVQYKGSYINGLKEGLWETLITKNEDFFNVNKPINTRFESINYKNGSRDGEIVRYFENVSIEKGLYIKGFKHGEWITNYENGSILKGLYENGLKQGEWTQILKDGQIEYLEKFINNKRDFKSFVFYEYKDGIKISKHIYINEKKMQITYYNEKGEVTKQKEKVYSN